MVLFLQCYTLLNIIVLVRIRSVFWNLVDSAPIIAHCSCFVKSNFKISLTSRKIYRIKEESTETDVRLLCFPCSTPTPLILTRAPALLMHAQHPHASLCSPRQPIPQLLQRERIVRRHRHRFCIATWRRFHRRRTVRTWINLFRKYQQPITRRT